MASLNKVLFIGNLTRDPELRSTPSGTAICEFGLAVNRTFSLPDGTQKKDTLFIDVNVWGHQAETMNRYLQKGSPIFIEGRLQYETWEDKEKVKRSKYKVVAEKIQFLGQSKGAGDRDVQNQEGSEEVPPNFENAQPQRSQAPPQRRENRPPVAPPPVQSRSEMPKPMPIPENVFEVDSQQGDDIPF